MRKRGLGVLALFAATGGIGTVQAAEGSVAAQALFDEGRRLLDEGNTAAACPKFAESLKLDPGVGTKFHLADCYEKVGRTASAWSLYLEVADESRKEGQADRARFAEQRAATLKPKLSHLVIRIEGVVVDGLTIERDGVPVGQAQYDLPLPVDPGTHVVRAEAPGYEPWQAKVEVGRDGSEAKLLVPPLKALPEKPESNETGLGVSTSFADVPSPAWTTPQKIGVGLAGAGVLGLGAGAFFALRATSLNDDSKQSDLCDGNRCSQEGANLRQDALDAGNLATILVVAGGVLGVSGGALFLLTGDGSSEPTESPLTARIVVSPTSSGLMAWGEF